MEPVALNRYCARIGYSRPRTPDVDMLHALTAAHAQSIPFENLDVVLGRRIELEPAALVAKLVDARRGGYCFEQNGLLLEVLRAVGFEARALSARVRLGSVDRAEVPARTHMLLEVRIKGESWLTDVGVGAASLSRALRWQADLVQATRHEPRRLVHEDGRWFHQMRRGDAWVDVYEFTGESMPFIDRVVASWYVSTHPQSHFTRTVMVALAQSGGGRVTLQGCALSLRAADGGEEARLLSSPADYGACLRRHFGIELPAAAVATLFHAS